MNFEEMVSFPDQLLISHWVGAKYLASRFHMYWKSLRHNVHVEVDSTSGP